MQGSSSKVPPPHFSAILGTNDFYFHFESEEKLRTWHNIADALWNEYIELVKKYYELGGIRE